MLTYFDLDLKTLVESPGSTAPASDFTVVYGRGQVFRVGLVRGGALTTLADGETLRVVLKEPGKYDADPAAASETFALDSATGLYVTKVHLIGGLFDTLLAVDAEVQNDVAEAALVVQYAIKGEADVDWKRSQIVPVTLNNSYMRESDGEPATEGSTTLTTVGASVVRYSATQSLTAGAKGQALDNLGLVSLEDDAVRRVDLSPGVKGYALPLDLSGVTFSGSPGSAPAVPVNTVAPSIPSSPTYGDTLTVTPGTWTGATSVSYQWRRNGSNITGATNASYTVTFDDIGQTLLVRETAVNAGGSAVQASNSVVPTFVATADFGGLTADSTALTADNG